jgi:cell division protein FtsL
MKKPFLLIIFFIVTIIGLSVVQVAISNRLSTTGIELENLQSQMAKYKKENTLLEEKVLEASALVNVSQKAKSLGFVDVKSQIYLSNPLPLALNQ